MSSVRLWVLLAIAAVGVFAGLRGVAALTGPDQQLVSLTPPVVVVGVTDHARLDAAETALLDRHLGNAQVAMMSIRPRLVGECAAAGWTTLGAGRRATVAGLCDPQVVDGQVADWTGRQQAAARDRGDAQLGTLRSSIAGCVAAVGPGAALAAADPTGRVDSYRSVAAFVTDGMTASCPITLVDPGDRADAVIAALAERDDITLIVTGVGPPPGADDPSLQVVYRLGTTFPGWLTSASTRREAIVTLTDLTRTLIDVSPARPGAVPLTVDGSPFAVIPADLTSGAVQTRTRAVTALSDAAVTGYLVFAAGGSVLFLFGLFGLVRRRFTAPLTVLAYGCGLLAVMMLVGSVPWPSSARPGLVVGLAIGGWSVVMTALTVLLARRSGWPAPVVAAALSVAAFTVDAALGGPMQPGSLINSRPIYGLRWYGFGNVTFAAYASAGLLLAGYLAHRLLAIGRRRLAVVVVGVIGFGIVVCEGWPTMGTDFGGVIALTPPVLWLLLVLSGVRITWAKLVAVGAAAVVAVAAISLADWSRGPDRRSHLGNFVQRIIDGDAVDVVSRKAVASVETIIHPLGLVCLVVGVPLWILVFRYVVPVLAGHLTTIRPVLLAALATAVLGTLLNDGGISVWLTVTAWVTTAMGWFMIDRTRQDGWTATLAAARGR